MDVREYKDNEVDSWEEVNLIYNAALKQVQTKLEILNEAFQRVHKYNPIEHIKARIKSSESIVKKLKRKGQDISLECAKHVLNDMAGIRVICSFQDDIYMLADCLLQQDDV